ncbi:peptidylprolyl isomerase [Prevotella sp. E15-22]|jgi:peptidyl-prolyl cis-trans isomerase SurA|uniref:peptidylprolyl isomerase n=1 Tax=Prevotella sp. E15-22 TaxID=2937774 RepID=UPI0020462C1E|nr:peptidylprolyl isomerase [Prevotella sp. E15-22]UPS43858.1 peptidylprolyl isomerase [Prevotella sp. E15-22]
MKKYIVVIAGLLSLLPVCAQQDDKSGSVVDEVIWVVGDEPILRSEVEANRMMSAMEGIRWNGDPDCAIPEQLAVQKLFLHQAAIDSIEVKESEISSGIEQRIEEWIQQIGSREKLEEYKKQTLSQIRESMHDEYRDQLLIRRMKERLVKDITVTPAEVRRYFRNLPQDSIPYVPTEVEVQILTMTPRISTEEINRVKDELRDYTDRVNRGETSFQTLARLYSEDPGSRRMGGELPFMGRAELDPAFAAAAFNLTDPKKISKIVESEFGMHIIQLVEKRGDKVKVRHILRKPLVADSTVNAALARLDSIGDDIRNNVFTFEDGATVISDDKDTRANKGLMAKKSQYGQTLSSRFQLQDLPPEIARVVDTLQVGQVSKAFTMINNRDKTVCVIAKLKNRIEGHKATITEDFQVMKEVVLNKRQEEKLHDWVVQKIKSTYVRLNDDYKNCHFEYEGWNR